MCTLIALWKHHPAAPLVLALNRDEFLARPTEPPHVWSAGDPPRRILAGRDLQSGGTWFGVGQAVVAALTNHRNPGNRPDPGKRSRGELVVQAIASADLAEAQGAFVGMDAEDFAPFHLLVTNGQEMGWLTNRGGTMQYREVEPGLHVLGNYGLNDAHDPVVATMREELAGVEKLDEPELHGRLREALSGHGAGRPCVHFGPYGTRSSAILYWGKLRTRLWTTPGAPCLGGWQEREDLLEELRVEPEPEPSEAGTGKSEG